MLSAIAFGSSRCLVNYIQETCAEVQDLCLYKVLYTYPTRLELAQLLNTFAPEVVFLDLVSSQSALEIVSQIRASRPKTVIIGFIDQLEEARFRAAVQAGASEVLPAPCEPGEFARAVLRAMQTQGTEVRDNIIVFLPAKAGSGATTIALHVAASLVADWDQQVVLLETDQHSGSLSVRLDLRPQVSILDVLEDSQWLSDDSWPRMPQRVHGLDLLPMPMLPKAGAISPWDYQRLLTFVRARYETVINDFSELRDSATEWIAAQARLVYVVATPEREAWFLAGRRIDKLKSHGVPDSHIRVILNRCWHKEWDSEEIEARLERPLSLVLPYHERLLRRPRGTSPLADPGSDLGKALRSFAATLVKAPPATLGVAETKSGLLARFRQRALT